MTEEEKQKLFSDLNLEMIKPFDFKANLPESMRKELEFSELLTDFTLSFLSNRKSGKRKIDQLVLSKNKLDISLFRFIKKQSAVDLKYAEIIKQTDEYIILKITQEGIEYFNNHSIKYRTKSVNPIKRISLYVLKLIRQFWSFVFVSANNRIKIMMESGIIKLIGFLIMLITFILKWDDIKVLIHKWTE